MRRRVLVIGGNRSGKSRFAESLLGSTAEYVATGAPDPDDEDWTERIRQHRSRRAPGWRTIETADPAAVLAEPGLPVLLDSITAWVTRTMDASGSWAQVGPASAHAEAVDGLVRAWTDTPRVAVAVTDEVGLGIVPATPSGRRFRDELGLLNQRLAAAADEVHLVVAGLTVRMK